MFPDDRDRLLRVVGEAEGTTVFLSGDRHRGEISVLKSFGERPLFDITASSFNHCYPGAETNRLRVGTIIDQPHFGWLEIDWEASSIETQLVSAESGLPLLTKTVEIRSLTRGGRSLASILDPDSRRVLIAAHRGGYEEDLKNKAPENSVANVRVAVKAGFEIYETDLQRTRDGRFVVVHDPTIERETDGTGAVADLDYAAVRKLRKKYRDGSLSEERVATFEQLLKAGRRDLLFKVDLKPGVIEHFDELARIVEEHGMMDRVFFRISWKEADRIERRFEEGTPHSPGLVMFKAGGPKEAQEAIRRFSPTTIQINVPKAGPLQEYHREAIRLAVKAGVCVEAHAQSDPERWRELVELGVRIFHSDPKPSRLRDWLDEEGLR